MKINSNLNIQRLLFSYIVFCFATRLCTDLMLFEQRFTRIALYSLLFIATTVELFNIKKIKSEWKKSVKIKDRILHICYLFSCITLFFSFIFQLVITISI